MKQARDRGLTRPSSLMNIELMNTERTEPILSEKQFELIAKALADPRRMAILESIGGMRECPCQRLVNRFSVSKGTISHHMKELEQAGLITARKEGAFRHYEVRRDVLAAYTAELMRRMARPGAA
jgi:ArsR family transcriptional regulator